jgi:hypothetical protein
MSEESQRLLDHDNLEEARHNLNEFTGRINKKSYIKEIEEMDNKKLDELQLGFHNTNPNLTFEETLLVKKVFDYMKGL